MTIFNEIGLNAVVSRIGVIGLLCLTLFGCATMNAEDCVNADWRSLGMQDGARGNSLNRIESRAKVCQKHGLAIKRAEYQKGYKQGIAQFCTPANGYDYGTSKRQYAYVCPNNLEAGFLKGYVKGLNWAIDEVDDDIRNAELDIRSAKLDLRVAKTEEKREKARSKLDYRIRRVKNLNKERDRIKRWYNKALNKL